MVWSLGVVAVDFLCFIFVLYTFWRDTQKSDLKINVNIVIEFDEMLIKKSTVFSRRKDFLWYNYSKIKST